RQHDPRRGHRREKTGSVVQAMSAPRIALAMPSGAKLNAHNLAVTAVGIAHGTSTAARGRDRPQMFFPMITSMVKPRTVSSETVVTVKKSVLAIAGQKSTEETPGGHVTAPSPPGPGHAWVSQ